MGKLEYAVPPKRDTKKNPFCMYYNKFFLKYCIHDNHWIGHSVMKQVDDVEFHKRWLFREGNNGKSYNYEMEIMDEGVIDKVLEVPGKL